MKKLNIGRIAFLVVYVISILLGFILIVAAAINFTKQAEPSVLDTEEDTQTFATTLYTMPLPSIFPEKVATPVLFPEHCYSVFYDTESSLEYITELNNSINELSSAIASNKYTSEANKEMYLEENRLIILRNKIEADRNLIVQWESAYPYATGVWKFFRQKGYSETITAAIIGNMMIETSGGTLALKPTVYDPTGEYYGLCQWALRYNPTIADASFEEQLEYLYAGIEREFRVHGKKYKEGFTFEDFLAMEDPAEAAFAFSKVYERCASWSCDLRRPTAEKAYEYFKLNN